MAPTLKIPEGDQLRPFIRANTAGNIVAGTNRTFGVVRRYLSGSDVDWKHFNSYDGGLKSNKQYYNDVQYLSTTVANRWVISWTNTIIRNEAYKFFQGGILPDANLATAAMVSRLTQAKILIDDPQTQYNEYYCNAHFNNLPFMSSTHTYGDGSVATPWAWPLERQHRFTPTIDVVKNRNKNLVVYVQDDGNVATDIYTAMIGVKFQV